MHILVLFNRPVFSCSRLHLPFFQETLFIEFSHIEISPKIFTFAYYFLYNLCWLFCLKIHSVTISSNNTTPSGSTQSGGNDSHTVREMIFTIASPWALPYLLPSIS